MTLFPPLQEAAPVPSAGSPAAALPAQVVMEQTAAGDVTGGTAHQTQAADVIVLSTTSDRTAMPGVLQ